MRGFCRGIDLDALVRTDLGAERVDPLAVDQHPAFFDPLVRFAARAQAEFRHQLGQAQRAWRVFVIAARRARSDVGVIVAFGSGCGRRAARFVGTGRAVVIAKAAAGGRQRLVEAASGPFAPVAALVTLAGTRRTIAELMSGRCPFAAVVARRTRRTVGSVTVTTFDGLRESALATPGIATFAVKTARCAVAARPAFSTAALLRGATVAAEAGPIRGVARRTLAARSAFRRTADTRARPAERATFAVVATRGAVAFETAGRAVAAICVAFEAAGRTLTIVPARRTVAALKPAGCAFVSVRASLEAAGCALAALATIRTAFKATRRTLVALAAALKAARSALAAFAISATRSAFATIAAAFKPAGRTLTIVPAWCTVAPEAGPIRGVARRTLAARSAFRRPAGARARTAE
ncbi:hypothetical protein GCM10011400_07440 [Paraburkholderia caffeinilytica]|uniref:Uncharacterized protein n=1 Tax=Paraburkholderia caffeinilytica TaxID=1761016 RepID=A0ABQ1LHV4_9BURK|nr:hypothetical protein GCM10011400_07440 [Paraburkholderia caffeinilytica]